MELITPAHGEVGPCLAFVMGTLKSSPDYSNYATACLLDVA